MKKILVIGVGYVGLVTGTCFAEMGYHVTCLDIDKEKIQNLHQAIIPIYEPGLEEIVQRNLKAKRLVFTTDYENSVPLADICFIAVDTPMTLEGKADTSQVEAVAQSLGAYLTRFCTIVTKSTVPVGTTALVGQIIRKKLYERGMSISFDLVSNPEFLKEGNAIQDFMKPDRIIIGADNEQAISLMKELYSPFMHNHDRLLVMDIASAELSKYAANAMLATRISFMNEIALLCERLGANVNLIRKAIGSDDRIGSKFLYPGVGFGGSCLPKDVGALIAQGNNCGIDLSIMQAVQDVNRKQKNIMVDKLHFYFSSQGGLEGKTLGILGLSFKPDTDDIREAPALALIQALLSQGVALRLYDPIAMPKAKSALGLHPSLTWCQDELEVSEGADALVLMTEWKQFRLLNIEDILSRMTGRGFFDGRNQYQAEEMARHGFDYFGIGQQPMYADSSSLEAITHLLLQPTSN